MQYDVFISHASEDKDGFVRELAHELAEQRLHVWYDEFSLTVGNSIRRSIDHGLSRSRFGIVVLSPSFFAKHWTEWELDGLIGRQNQLGNNVILPVWHEIGYAGVAAQSPSLAGLMAIPSSVGVKEVVRGLLKAIRPEGSTLEVARHIALSHGLDVPIITDDYWLEVAQWAGTGLEEPWAFPLPDQESTPQERGTRLGWAALQWSWTTEAWRLRPHTLMHPDEILKFIKAQPGLTEMCLAHPEELAKYAPLLTIKGMGGPFEHAFDRAMTLSIQEHSNGSRKGCAKRWLLRHETFCNCEPYDAMHSLAYRWWSPYQIDHAAWLLSKASAWLPNQHHDFLLKAIKEYAQWPQWAGDDLYHPYTYEGDAFGMQRLLSKAYSQEDREVTSEMRMLLDSRLVISVKEMGLPESATDLAQNFLDEGFVDAWFTQRDLERKSNTIGGDDI